MRRVKLHSSYRYRFIRAVVAGQFKLRHGRNIKRWAKRQLSRVQREWSKELVDEADRDRELSDRTLGLEDS